MKATVLRGDVFDVLPALAAGSVDCCVTSPPYWALRSYLPEGHPLKPRELGSEKTPAEYVARMVEVFRLVRAALAPWGTCWLNVGDTYAGGASGQINLDAWTGTSRQKDESSYKHRRPPALGVAPGNLCLIPWRLAIALQDDGWLVRSVVVWHKPAPMPASLAGWRWARCRVKVKAGGTGPGGVRGGIGQVGMWDQGMHYMQPGGLATWADCPGCPRCEPHGGYVLRRGSWRPTSSWEPVLMLAKGPAYYADGEAVKTPVTPATVDRRNYSFVCDDGGQYAARHDHENWGDSGANLRDVWTIAAEPLKEKHYAAFPSELVYRCLAAGTSQKGYCSAKIKKLKVKDNLTPEQKERVAKFLSRKGLI
jgi:DNA modification methylase